MDSLEDNFKKYVLIFIFAVLIISSVAFYIPIEQTIVNDRKAEIEHEIQLNFKDIKSGIESHEENIKALSSRTMIKEKLYAYLQGNLSLEELENYTHTKYNDGSEVYKNLLASKRVSRDNKVIAFYGNQTHLMNKTDITKEFDVINEDNQTLLYIKKPIHYDSIYLGYDTGLFNATSLFDSCENSRKSGCINYSITETEKLDRYEDLEDKNIYTSELKSGRYYLVATYDEDLLDKNLGHINFYMASFVLVLLGTLLPLSYFTIYKQANNIIKSYEITANELEKSNKFKDTFTDIIRHDLLNPAGVISGYLKILLNKEQDENKRYLLKKVQSSNIKIIELLENSSEFAKLENIENLEFEDKDIVKIIKKGVYDFQFQLSNKNLETRILINKEHLCKINPIIEQAFANLLSNAIKYSPEDSFIKVYIKDNGNYWKINVADFGDGVPDEDKSYLFDRFTRKDKKGIKGSGFGLAIAKMIVELHGGDIGVENNPEGKGSVFWFTLEKGDGNIPSN
ncbi:MAG: sensor histidine kinase [Methanohalobium sp.]|uniref:sensor histidine kinase n=1 Tax=Methanohalobium sp. TaxID=2837493 RepID=UPI00397BA92C